MEASRLVVTSVTKSFSTAGEPLEVLSGVDLSLAAGQSVAIVGPSGSGKTTLLQILGTLDEPDSGEVQIAGEDPFSLGPTERAGFRNRHIGFVFQDHHLLPQLSVLDNVLIPALAAGRPDGETVSRAESLIESVGLGDRITHRPAELSGGQRERVAIARALVMEPDVILADEPTGNLDAKTASEVTALLRQLQSDRGVVLVAVTHSRALATAMDRCFELREGQLVRDAAFENVT
ncbi:MAG: ABC transporter ATP-binding protein [Planctomycetota bacterium]